VRGVTMTQEIEGERGDMEVEPQQGWGMVAFLAVLHFLCCGVPLLLPSVVSFTFLVPSSLRARPATGQQHTTSSSGGMTGLVSSVPTPSPGL
jgi:hypothetical protein